MVFTVAIEYLDLNSTSPSPSPAPPVVTKAGNLGLSCCGGGGLGSYAGIAAGLEKQVCSPLGQFSR